MDPRLLKVRQRRFLALTAVNSLGTGIFIAGGIIVYVKVCGLGVPQLGIGLSCAGLLSLVLATPLASLADRYPPRNVLASLYLLQGCGFLLLVIAHDIDLFILAVSLGVVGARASQSVRNVFLTTMFGVEERMRCKAAVRTIQNTATGLGAAASFIMFDLKGTELSVLLAIGNAASFGASALMLRAWFPGSASNGVVLGTARQRVRRRYGWLVGASLGNGVLTIHQCILIIGIPLWVLDVLKLPVTFAVLPLLLNTVLVAIFQRRWRHLGERFEGAMLAQSIGTGAIVCVISLLAAGPMVGIMLREVMVFLAAIIITLAEIVQSVGSWGLSFLLVRKGREAESQSVFNVGGAAAEVIGPAALTGIIAGRSELGWVAFAVGVVAARVVLGTCARRFSSASEPSSIEQAL